MNEIADDSTSAMKDSNMTVSTEVSTACPECLTPVTTEAEAVICPQCGATYHQTCWDHRGGCRLPECRGAVPTAEHLLSGYQPVGMARPTVNYFPWLLGGGIAVVLIAAGALAVALGVRLNSVLIIGVVVAALAFDYVNGMHDAGNAIATVISTRVLTPTAALCMAAVLNLLGALVHAGVAASIATKFADMRHLDPTAITPVMILCGLLGASAWSYFTANIGVPVSTSHSLFGGLIGVFLLGGIPLNRNYLGMIGLFMVLAPIMAFTAGWALMLILMWAFRRTTPYKVNRYFRSLQMLSSACMAFSHGSNDAQKAMGIITLALIGGGFLHVSAGNEVLVPLWVKVACAVVIALGTAFGGMRVIRTLGHKIIKLAPIHGFAAETVAAVTIQFVTLLKVPISTTHIISSSILGIGASKRLSAVRWGVAQNIVMAWVITIPTCAVAGAALYYLVRFSGLR